MSETEKPDILTEDDYQEMVMWVLRGNGGVMTEDEIWTAIQPVARWRRELRIGEALLVLLRDARVDLRPNADGSDFQLFARSEEAAA